MNFLHLAAIQVPAADGKIKMLKKKVNRDMVLDGQHQAPSVTGGSCPLTPTMTMITATIRVVEVLMWHPRGPEQSELMMKQM
jgi:hypothetical protein